MKELSSFDLFFLERELKQLIGGKIDNIYQYSKKHLIFQIFITGKGKVLLEWNNGFIFIKDKKEKNNVEMHLSKQLKKVLDQSRIQKIYQKNSERIIVIELLKKTKEKYETYYLVFELFKPFNLIFLSNDIIKIVAESVIYPKRKVILKEKYIFPESVNNFLEIKAKGLFEKTQESEMRTIATFMAIEMNLGGKFAEEILARALVDKNKKPSDITSNDAENIVLIKNELKSIKINACINDNNAFPFQFITFDQSENIKKQNFSEAIDAIILKEIIVNPYEGIIEKQKKVIEELKKEIELNKQIGDLIYTNYTLIKTELEKNKKKSKQISIDVE